MILTPVQLCGTIVLVGVLLGLGLPVLVDGFVREWQRARAEDEGWRNARRELAGADEIVGLDARLIRPWGDSVAVERFVVTARLRGHGWLEPAVAPLQVEEPVAIRGVAGDLGGAKVAFLVARTRRAGTIAKRVALGPAGLVEELAAECDAPDDGFTIELEALARRAKVAA